MARKGTCFWQYFFLLGREEFQWRTSFILIPESLWDTQLLWLQSIVMSQPDIINSTVTWKWKCVEEWWTKNDPDGAEAVEKSCKSTLNVSFVLGCEPLGFGAIRMVRFGSRSWPHCTDCSNHIWNLLLWWTNKMFLSMSKYLQPFKMILQITRILFWIVLKRIPLLMALDFICTRGLYLKREDLFLLFKKIISVLNSVY